MTAYNILIVDDDKDDHLFMSSAIKQAIPMANIKSFFDGVELTNYWFGESEVPNIIFLDLNMQIIDGRTALKNIRKDNTLKDIPVIILTTSTDPDERQRCMKLGASDFFVKPYTPADMSRIVEMVKLKWLFPAAAAS